MQNLYTSIDSGSNTRHVPVQSQTHGIYSFFFRLDLHQALHEPQLIQHSSFFNLTKNF